MKYCITWLAIFMPMALLYAYVSHQMDWPDWWGYGVGGLLGLLTMALLEPRGI